MKEKLEPLEFLSKKFLPDNLYMKVLFVSMANIKCTKAWDLADDSFKSGGG